MRVVWRVVFAAITGVMMLLPAVSFGQTVASPFIADESLSEEDLAADLEAETLPGSGFPYHWENLLFRIERLLTFNAEKKAELDRRRLHVLDRKAAACAEIGDEECLAQIQQRSERLEEISRRHLEKRQELRDKWLAQFEEWRARRNDRIEQFREAASDRAVDSDTLRQEWLDRREAVRTRRQQHLQQRRERFIERRDQRLDATRERIIERSTPSATPTTTSVQ